MNTTTTKHPSFQVDSSTTSDTTFKIKRVIHQVKGPLDTPKQVSNPYVFTPKSYSKKRVHESPKEKQFTVGLVKKNFGQREKNTSNKTKGFNINFSNLKKAVDDVKKNQDGVQQIQFLNCFSSFRNYPSQSLETPKKSQNSLLKRQVQIVSNSNSKITIPIHEGLYKCNTSHKNLNDQKEGLVLPNRFDIEFKNQYSNSIPFIREYKSGYAPIDMQNRNKDVDENDIKDTTNKTHFIRKKQSTLNLPRTCGVSYVKPSQSVGIQKPPFLPLPPLIFQGSTSCQISSNLQNLPELDKIKELTEQFVSMADTCWLPFIMADEQEMRNLLLNNYSSSYKMGFVQGIQNLWPLFSEGVFILVLFTSEPVKNQSQIWDLVKLKKTYFKVGILVKKSTSGKRSFLRSIKTQNQQALSQITQQKPDELQFEQKSQQNKKQNTEYVNLIKADQQSPKQQKKFETNFQQRGSKKQAEMMEYLQTQLKDSRTVITMSLRFEMYVQPQDWKSNFGIVQKKLLNEFIITLKQRLQKKSISIIKERFQLSKAQNRQKMVVPFLSKIRLFNQQAKIQNVQTIEKNISDKQNFSLDIVSKIIQNHRKFDNNSQNCFLKNSSTIAFQQIPKLKIESWERSLKMPIYYISTRDSFAFDLIQTTTILKRQNGRQYNKIDYYFYPDNVPTNYGSQYKKLFPNLDVGVTSYHGFFSEEELQGFQKNTFETENNAFKNKFLQMTVQPSIVGTKIKRTKFFFGYRYMWTRCQLAQPTSYVGAGVRKDVTPQAAWTKSIQNQMVKQGIVQKDFLNSIAINVYHDGRQGLAQHFDDAVRFKQPIFTLRLFSDARLSFGSQFYGFCNGAFIIPLPRGCICVMQQNSYAANGVKHCVRPCDMTGKSAAVILRQMHWQVVNEASKYDELIDFPAWISCLSEQEKAVTFAQQKRIQAQQLID